MVCMHIVIIGSGIAGDTAALTIRELDKEVKITMISDENAPLYSACVFHKYISGELERKRVFLKKIEDYSDEDIDILFGQHVSKVDTEKKKLFLENAHLNYDRLIIATGSRPRIPPIEGSNKNGVFCLKSVEDADKIVNHRGSNAVVIGAGPIGIEAGIALQKRGYEVYVIEMLDRVLPRLFDKKPASILSELMEEHGIKVFTNEMVGKIVGTEEVSGVKTNKRELECDTVLLSCGMRPNTEFAEKSGIELGKYKGIKVNPQMMTNIKDVYACGDCVETKDVVTGKEKLSLLWHTAKLQGYIAGCNCLGTPKTYPGSLNYTIVEVFEKYAVSSGNTAGELEAQNPKVTDIGNSGTYRRLILADNRIVGLQFVGEKIIDLGLPLGAIRRGDSIKFLEKIFKKEELFSHVPWLTWMRPFLARID